MSMLEEIGFLVVNGLWNNLAAEFELFDCRSSKWWTNLLKLNRLCSTENVVMSFHLAQSIHFDSSGFVAGTGACTNAVKSSDESYGESSGKSLGKSSDEFVWSYDIAHMRLHLLQ